MNTTIKRISIGLLIVIFLSAWFLLSPHENARITDFQIRYGFIGVGPSHAIYGAVNFDEKVDLSDVIAVGKVVNISPTMWNQDSGEYWNDPGAFTYHTVQLEVSQYIVDRIGLEDKKTIEVLCLEPSPLDGGNADYSLSIGDIAMVFASNANIGWQGGTKSFFEMMEPSSSIFVQDNDGNFKGFVLHNLGKGNFKTFATKKGQEKFRTGAIKMKANPQAKANGFISEEISISLPDFIKQIQAADQNQPIP